MASNKALEVLKGDWICRLDDDDTWTKDHLEVLLQFAQEGNYDFVSAQYEAMKHNKKYLVGADLNGIGGIQTWLYKAKLKVFKYNIDCWRKRWNRVNDIDLSIVCVSANRNWQRIGFNCDEPSSPPLDYGVNIDVFNTRATVHSFTSQDSITNVNYITVNSNVITRPPISISDIREAYFKDGWENEKYFYIEQSTANPCIVQFVDIYAETENEE